MCSIFHALIRSKISINNLQIHFNIYDYVIHNVDENIKNKIHHKYWSAFDGYPYILEKTCLCRVDFITRDGHNKQLHT